MENDAALLEADGLSADGPVGLTNGPVFHMVRKDYSGQSSAPSGSLDVSVRVDTPQRPNHTAVVHLVEETQGRYEGYGEHMKRPAGRAAPDVEQEEPIDHRSEFERFEELTRKLVRVPKRALDEERSKTNGHSPEK